MKSAITFLSFLSCLLLPGWLASQNYFIKEDFNQASLPNGWSNSALNGSQTWSFGIDGANVHPNNQNLDGTPMAYFDDDVLGKSLSNNHITLTTPTFDNSGLLNTLLEFDFNFREYSAVLDSFVVEVYDGSQWQMVFSRDTNNCGNFIGPTCNDGFPHAKIDITAYQNPSCQVRFRYYDGHDPNDWGWYVGLDNVEVYTPFSNDLKVSSIVSPQSSCGLSSAEVIEVSIQNEGSDTTSAFPISFALNGIEIVTETVTASLAYSDTLVYQFITTANLSATGQYQISVYPKLPNDSNRLNDTSTVFIQNDTLYALPYSNDFETNLANWTVSGTNATWQKGIPTSAPIDTAASGTQAWVTNLNGPYNNNELSYLTSPCLDFSALSNDPVIRFELNYKIELNYDFAWMEYSLDFGGTWQKVMASTYALNWYNHSAQNAWSGNSNGWRAVENRLNGLAGEPSVKLRLVFNSDPSTTSQGFGFDKLSISEPSTTDLAITESLSPILNQNLDCAYDSKTNIITKIKNYGIQDTFQLSYHYQVSGGTVYSSNHLVSLNTLEDTAIVADSTFDFDPTQNYQFKSWISVNADTNLNNDTLSGNVQNDTAISSTVMPPISEDFSNSVPGSGFSNNGSQLISNWINYSSRGAGGWRISNGNYHSNNTAPANLSVPNDNFAYLEASVYSSPGESIFLESPCFTVPLDSSVKLAFDYHKYGSGMGDLYIEVSRNYDDWHRIDSIKGQTHFSSYYPWSRKSIALTDYSGQVIKVRFVGVAAGGYLGDMAIDNIKISQADPYSYKLISINEPIESCLLTDSSQIAFKLKNEGDSTIRRDSLLYYYQINNGPISIDTLDHNISPYSYDTLYFNQRTNLSAIDSLYKVKVWTQFLNGNQAIYDTLERNYKIFNLNILDDFESYINGREFTEEDYKWKSNNYRYWRNWTISDTAINSASGPVVDHTLGQSGNGQFIYLEGNSTGYFHELKSPCFDFQYVGQAELVYWVHNFGAFSHSFELLLDRYVFQQNNFIGKTTARVDNFNGPRQSTQTAPWAKRTIDLSTYTGQYRVRLIFKLYLGTNEIFALDDFSLVDSNLITSYKTEIKQIPYHLSLYPNPSKGQYFIQSEASLAGLNYQVYDLRGQLIQSGNFEGKKEHIDLSAQPNGVYFLHLPELKLREKLVKY
ncbi:MAG: T9SS type A sorting domain-containing protein [Vicingaceae bacterium]